MAAMLQQQPRIVKKTTVIGKNASTTLKVQINKTYTGSNAERPKVSRRVPNPSTEQLHDYVKVNRAETQRSRPPAGTLLRQKQREKIRVNPVPDRNIQMASFHHYNNNRPNSARSELGNNRQIVNKAWDNKINSSKSKHSDIQISFKNNKYQRPTRYVDTKNTFDRPKTSRNTQHPSTEQYYNYINNNRSTKPSDLPRSKNEIPLRGKHSRVMSIRPEDDKNTPLVYDVKVPRGKQQNMRYKNNRSDQTLGNNFSTMETNRNRRFNDNRPNTLLGESTRKLSKRFDRGYVSKRNKKNNKFSSKQFYDEKMIVEVNGRRGVIHFEKLKYKKGNNAVLSTEGKNEMKSNNDLFKCRSKDIMVTTVPNRGGSGVKDNVLKNGWFKSKNAAGYDSDSDYDSDDSQESWRPAWNSSTKLATGLKKRLHGESRRSLKIVNDNNKAAAKAALRRKAKNHKHKHHRNHKKEHDHDHHHHHHHHHHDHKHKHKNKKYSDEDDYDSSSPTRKVYSKKKKYSSAESDYYTSEEEDNRSRRRNNERNKKKKKKYSSDEDDDDDDFWSSSSSSDEDSYDRYRAKKNKNKQSGNNKGKLQDNKTSIGSYVNGLIYRSDRSWPSQTIHQYGTTGAGW